MPVDGNFVPSLRSQYIRAARGAFDRTVENSSLGSSGVIETSTDYVKVQSYSSKTQGNNIGVEIYNQADTSEDGGCGKVINTITTGDALPEIASLFRAVGFLCSGAEGVKFDGDATG